MKSCGNRDGFSLHGLDEAPRLDAVELGQDFIEQHAMPAHHDDRACDVVLGDRDSRGGHPATVPAPAGEGNEP